MNWLDIIIIIALAGSVIYSVVKGFVKEVFFLAGVVAGLLVALRGYSYLAVYLYPTIGNPATAKILSFLIILSVIFAIFKIIGWRTGKAFQQAGLTSLDRILGAVLGGLKGVVIVSVALLLLIGFTFDGERYVAGSRLSPYFLEFSSLLSRALPKKVRTGFKQAYENLQDPKRIKELMETLKKENKKE